MSEVMKPEDRKPDYKAAMLYHSDRADAYMAERDALAARVKELEAERDRYLRHLTAGAESLNEYKYRAEAAEAEARALVAAALQRAAGIAGDRAWGAEIAKSIRALIDTDHAAALEAVKAQAREDAWKELQRERPFILGANHGWDEALEWAADQVSARGKARVDESVRAWAKDRAAAIRAGKGQP